MVRFEVGKTYGAGDAGLNPITVLKRTAKMIQVNNGYATWRMRIKECHNINGFDTEYVTDSTYPKKWAEAVTYYAVYEEQNDEN